MEFKSLVYLLVYCIHFYALYIESKIYIYIFFYPLRITFLPLGAIFFLSRMCGLG